MKRFKKILFVADGSKGEKAVLARAAQLADVNQARLTLFDTVTTEGYDTADPAVGALFQTLLKARAQERREDLETLRKAVVGKHAKLRSDVEVFIGSRARSAIRLVLKKKYDLVIKAPEGGSGRLRLLFGSTDQTLMRKCPCPVWMVKPMRTKRFQRILAAVDVNPAEPETELLARQIVSLATALAKDEKSELHILHAWHLSGEYKLRGRQIYASKVEELLREIREAHQSEIDTLLKHYPYKRRTVHMLKGKGGDLIPKAVEKLGIDLIVIGTVGRTGVPGLLIGNTAETVLNSVDCSVLTLKPEGFVSPLQV